MNFKCKQRMIEQVLTRRNLLRAMRKVQKNHGSAGVDRMPVTKLSELMSIDREALITRVQTGNYLPQAILGVKIPKGNGKYRLLGIPTVCDRLLQQAVSLVITARFEFEFSESSYGFRPKRIENHERYFLINSVNKCAEGSIKSTGLYKRRVSAHSRYRLADFSASWRIDHCHLLQLLYRKIKCRETLGLIRKWLRAPILIDGKLIKRRKGIPQEGRAYIKYPVDIFSE